MDHNMFADFYLDEDEGSQSQPDSSQNLWWLGAIIYMCGSIFINLGSNIVRLSHERRKLLPESEQNVPFYKRYLWMAGFLIFFCGNISNFVGFMFGPQSLLVSLGSVQFVTNLIFARFINKEKLTIRAFLATGAIIAGNVVIVTFGSKSDETYDLEQLAEFALQIPFLIYAGFVVVSVICLQSIYLILKYKVVMSTAPTPDSVVKFMPFAYAAVSTMVGSTSVSIGKAMSGLVKAEFEGHGIIFKSVYPWMLLASFLCFVVFWLTRMNKALRQYDAMFIIPVLQALWLLFAVLGGGIFFEEFEALSVLDNCMFAVGIMILLLGVATLSPASFPQTEVEEEVIDKIASIRDYHQSGEYAQIDDYTKDEFLKGSDPYPIRQQNKVVIVYSHERASAPS